MGTPENLRSYIVQTQSKENMEDESLSSVSPLNDASVETNLLKKDIRFFFLNPIEKWKTKHRLPYKFVIQVIKIILVTYQLCEFADNRYNYLNYATNNKLAFSRLFIKNWDASKEVISYPPISGPMAVSLKSDLIENINYSINKMSNLNDTIGIFRHAPDQPIELCLKHYLNLNYSTMPEVLLRCFKISESETANFSLERFFEEQRFSVEYQLLLQLKLKFSIIGFSYRPGGARCSLFEVLINFDNENMDGLMKITMESDLKNHSLCDKIFRRSNHAEMLRHEFVSGLVIVICVISLILCMRAVVRAQVLKKRTIEYFRRVRGSELSMEGRLEFWNFWYIMIIVNDVLIIVGSYMERQINRNEYATTRWNICSLCLGTGTMLVWFGVLRYFGFFKNYNIVILTLKRAFPEMMRFLLGTLIIYAGFIFCGWLVLGPFHVKFRSLSRTSENLFSLVNGDDMFATFTILNSESIILWWYSRLYLYGFISLFIYVILNLFMAVILDAYETIKEYYTTGFPKSDLHQFICEPGGEDDDNYISANTRTDYIQGPYCFLRSLFCWRSV